MMPFIRLAKHSATIKSQSITIGSTTINGGSGTINAVTDGLVKVTATDGRWFTNQISSKHTIVDYVKLTCAIEAGAASTSGVAQLKVSGNYWNGNFGAAANTLTIQYRYKAQDGSFTSWRNSSAAVTKSNNTYSTTISISGLDYTKAYTFQARAIDKLATIESGGQTRKTQPIFDWGVDSSGAADFNVNGTLKINNRNIIDIIYPVNSIYMSLNSVNPSTLFGGTWEQIKDTFLLAAGATYKAGSTGGEATHTLTQAEMPKHNHVIYYPNAGGPDEGAALGFPETGSKNTWWAPASMTGQTGDSKAHNNMPPYLAVYIWKRTA